MKHILVINSGSSSLKFKIIALPSATSVVEGSVSGIGEESSQQHLRVLLSNSKVDHNRNVQWKCVDHEMAFNAVIDDLNAIFNEFQELHIDAIGHRVVHGGEHFILPAILDQQVIEDIAKLTHLAPQHLPSNVLGMRLCNKLFPSLPQVAVFDTAFHHSMPEHAYRYPIPDKWFKDYGIRRFGFHGSSHRYIASIAAKQLNIPIEQVNLISLHLGNGASACAIQHGKSIDTSMGFTPLEGLMMGNRSGDLDAAIPLYLQQEYGLSAEDVEHQLNFDSGLQAICGSHDMHDIIERTKQDEHDANLALEMFIYHVRKYLGAYLFALENIDAIVFTGGIGEHAPLIRARCCEHLERFGIHLDEQLNTQQFESNCAEISAKDSTTKIFLITTNEELQIAQETSDALQLSD